eukprot:4248136-Prymnesium_polylepis.2
MALTDRGARGGGACRARTRTSCATGPTAPPSACRSARSMSSARTSTSRRRIREIACSVPAQPAPERHGAPVSRGS